ncbi:hypothetical protein Tco_1090196 [Tanacetum coccineum]|uniref:Uncharacterized protein n=1 Tax=Tanacetum coccineum TaxID=301880 RepID=A0ABQ5I3N8_9ASTR
MAANNKTDRTLAVQTKPKAPMAMAAARGGGDGDEGGDDGVKVMRVVYGGEWVVCGAAMVRQRRCGCRRGWAARGRK